MTLRLECVNEQEEVALPAGIEGKLEQLLMLAGQMESIESGDVSVTFVDDPSIRELNVQYRNMDKPTDVLSFSMWETTDQEPDIQYEFDEDEEEPAPDDPIGDIVISVPTAKRQSEEYGHSLERELGFLFVHGFLHLIGYDHEDEEAEKVMIEKQEQVLRQAGLFR